MQTYKAHLPKQARGAYIENFVVIFSEQSQMLESASTILRAKTHVSSRVCRITPQDEGGTID